MLPFCMRVCLLSMQYLIHASVSDNKTKTHPHLSNKLFIPSKLQTIVFTRKPYHSPARKNDAVARLSTTWRRESKKSWEKHTDRWRAVIVTQALSKSIRRKEEVGCWGVCLFVCSCRKTLDSFESEAGPIAEKCPPHCGSAGSPTARIAVVSPERNKVKLQGWRMES